MFVTLGEPPLTLAAISANEYGGYFSIERSGAGPRGSVSSHPLACTDFYLPVQVDEDTFAQWREAVRDLLAGRQQRSYIELSSGPDASVTVELDCVHHRLAIELHLPTLRDTMINVRHVVPMGGPDLTAMLVLLDHVAEHGVLAGSE